MTCPSCGERTDPHRLEGHYGREIVLDVCRRCQALWFDGQESIQLTPGATLRLFAILHDKGGAERRPLADVLRCPRCHTRLVATTDWQRGTSFHYTRCPRDHGRFITVFQFLREKNFVRSLDPAEVQQLKQRIKMINCANCGSGVDLERAPACPYCRTPVAMLDPGQLEATVRALQGAEQKRQSVDPMLPVNLLLDRLRVESFYDRLDREAGRLRPVELVGEGLGIVVDALRAALRA